MFSHATYTKMAKQDQSHQEPHFCVAHNTTYFQKKNRPHTNRIHVFIQTKEFFNIFNTLFKKILGSLECRSHITVPANIQHCWVKKQFKNCIYRTPLPNQNQIT
jgi:hypothetical protein